MDGLMSPGCTITPWRRYGHNRLYITTDGTRLGYWDLNTNTAHPDDAANGPAIEAAVREWLSEQPAAPSTTPAVEAAVTPTPIAAHIDEPRLPPAGLRHRPEGHSADAPQWDDLAKNKAGAAARAQAQALRDAAPVRSFVGRVLGVKTAERAWRIGADGEEAVVAQLNKLGSPWRILHAVPVGTRGSDIDHIVIGPPGLFTLNTKNHPDANVWVRGDTFNVNGRNVPYIRNSRHAAARAAKLVTAASGIAVPAMGLVVVYGATRGFTVKEQPEDVHVIARRQVSRWLRSLPPVLDPQHIDVIYEHARRSTTWRQACW